MKDSSLSAPKSASSGQERTRSDSRQELLSLDTAAARLGICKRTLRRLIARGELPVVRVTQRTVRIPAVELDALVKARTAGGQSA